jgi:DNA (cytosine-5)-methyltransferase 1
MAVNYFSLFAGIGGFEYGIEKTGYGWRCVGYSEINQHASAVYRYHYPTPPNFGDATKIDPVGLPDFDVLCGGFPCQSFSIAGQRMGFKDTRGTLFFEIARIARCKRPRFLFLENVEGLLNHDNGRTFACILTSLSELGYDAEWEVLDSQNFGVPQHRERVFIIGHLRGQSSRHVFPIGQNVSESIDQVEQSKQGDDQMIIDVSQMMRPGDGVRKYYGISPTLNTMTGGYHQPIVFKRHRSNEIRDHGEISPTLTESHEHKGGSNPPIIITPDTIRKITPLECERLQGFPDDWTKYGLNLKGEKYPLSISQRYKCIGNAVTTTVIKAIATKLGGEYDAR